LLPSRFRGHWRAAIVKISKTKVDALKPKKSDYIIQDDVVPGFGVRIYPSGIKTYIFQYRRKHRTRRIALGKHGVLTPHTARQKAVELWNQVNNGDDPSANRYALDAGTTVAKLCKLYLEEGCDHKKPSTIEIDKGRILRHINPLLGKEIVADVTTDDVTKFMKDIIAGKTAADVRTKSRGRARVQGGKGTASRTVGLLGGIFTFAIRKGIRSDNPVRTVQKPKDNKRERFLSDGELNALLQLLNAPEDLPLNFNVAPAIKMLLFTGCRKSEILNLKWKYLDFKNRYILLPDSKTGDKKIPLNQPAIDVLNSVSKVSKNPYVFVGTGGGHFTALQKGWEKIRENLDMQDVRIHDLRHSFASILAGSGHSLVMIGKLLGHSDPKTTQIYAHLVDKQQLDASDQVGAYLSTIGKNIDE